MHLKLPTVSSQRISIKTFGSAEENSHCVDTVRLCINTDQGEDVERSAFVVLVICYPLRRQYVTEASLTYAYLKRIKLADYGCSEDNAEVNILAGSDQHWSLVSGKVVWRKDGPTAIETKLTWVLSDPTQMHHKLIGSKVTLSQHKF